MRIKHNIKFRNHIYTGKRKSMVIMSITFNNQRFEIATGFMLEDSGSWNDKSGCFVDGIKNTDGRTTEEMNRELMRQRETMEEVFRYFEAVEHVPDKAEVSQRYRNKMFGKSDPKPKTAPAADSKMTTEKKSQKAARTDERICTLYPIFIAERGTKNSWTKTIYVKSNALLKDMETFRPGLACADITEEYLIAFVEYLRSAKPLHAPRRKKAERTEGDTPYDMIGIRNSTIEQKLSYMRWFLNWATKKGLNVNQAYKTFKPAFKKTQKKIIFLTTEELSRIRNLDFTGKEWMNNIRDLLLFSCFSGLRYSDTQNLKWSDIKDDHIEVTTIKTSDSIRIELNDMTRALIEKYRPVNGQKTRVLPQITNQAMNREIKEMCRMAGIDESITIINFRGSERIEEVFPKWKLVGTHTGRRTFVVQALSRGVPANIVMKWTGHSDYKAMKPYIDIVDSLKATEMTKMNFL